MCLSPAIRLGIAYEDELKSSDIKFRKEVSSTFSKGTIKSYHKNHTKGVVGTNFTGIKKGGFSFYLNYQFEFTDSFHQHLGSARLEWGW